MVRLETLRLRMRPVQPRDLDSLSALNGDPHKMKYISPPLSRHQVKEALDWMIEEWHRIGYGWFAIFEKSSRAFVGQVGLQCFEYDPRSAETELAFVIKKSAWGEGYAREAAGEVLRFGFERHQFEKIVSVIAPENPAPQAILRKARFQLHGRAHRLWPPGDVFRNHPGPVPGLSAIGHFKGFALSGSDIKRACRKSLILR